MGPAAQNLIKVILYNEVVSIPLSYAEKVLDKNHQGSFSVNEASEDPRDL
jgi:hypothetical protein